MFAFGGQGTWVLPINSILHVLRILLYEIPKQLLQILSDSKAVYLQYENEERTRNRNQWKLR